MAFPEKPLRRLKRAAVRAHLHTCVCWYVSLSVWSHFKPAEVTLGAVVAMHSCLFLRLFSASVYPEHLRRTASTAGLRSVPNVQPDHSSTVNQDHIYNNDSQTHMGIIATTKRCEI